MYATILNVWCQCTLNPLSGRVVPVKNIDFSIKRAIILFRMNTLFAIIDQVMARKIAFLAAFFVFFTLSYGLLSVFDFLPEPLAVVTKPTTTEATSSLAVLKTQVVITHTATSTIKNPTVDTSGVPEVPVSGDALPIRMTIDALGRTVTVLNPASRNNVLLDEALLRGVIRHPDSATLTEEGNIFILGHSSYLPVVHNKNFQAFNGLQTLKWGDTIRVYSVDTEYVYRVEKSYKAQASTLTVPVMGKGHRLTLATCNSFGTKDDRYIVEATLLQTNKL